MELSKNQIFLFPFPSVLSQDGASHCSSCMFKPKAGVLRSRLELMWNVLGKDFSGLGSSASASVMLGCQDSQAALNLQNCWSSSFSSGRSEIHIAIDSLQSQGKEETLFAIRKGKKKWWRLTVRYKAARMLRWQWSDSDALRAVCVPYTGCTLSAHHWAARSVQTSRWKNLKEKKRLAFGLGVVVMSLGFLFSWEFIAVLVPQKDK